MPPPAAPPQRRPVLVGAHGGAGTTSWAAALDAVDGGTQLPPRGSASPVILVARASIAGITAAKIAVSEYRHPLACVLIVPAAPSRPHQVIRNELRVLGGAIPLVTVPWVPTLLIRRPDDVAPGDVPPKELARLRAELTNPHQ